MRTVGFLVAGFLAGVFSGGLGIGGAIAATPMIRMLGISPYLAVGTTVPALLPSALTGAFTYWRAGLVDLHAVRWVALPACVMAVAGAFTTRRIDGHLLMIATAGLLFILAVRLVPRRRRGMPGEDEDRSGRRSRWVYLGVGTVSGLLSGLLGVGGGFVMVPVFIKTLGFPTKVALGTSLTIISLMVVPNVAAQAAVGNIDWRAAALLTAGVIPGARLGALAAIRASDHRLQTVVGAVLAAVALAYGAFEVASLSSR